MSYPRVNLEDPTYRHVKAMLDRGQWACDAVDHNESDGCSNPTCFKYTPPRCRHVRPRASCMNPNCRANAAIAATHRALDRLLRERFVDIHQLMGDLDFAYIDDAAERRRLGKARNYSRIWGGIFLVHDVYRCTCYRCTERREEAANDARADV